MVKTSPDGRFRFVKVRRVERDLLCSMCVSVCHRENNSVKAFSRAYKNDGKFGRSIAGNCGDAGDGFVGECCKEGGSWEKHHGRSDRHLSCTSFVIGGGGGGENANTQTFVHERGISRLKNERVFLYSKHVNASAWLLLSMQGDSGESGATAYDTENGLLVGWNELNLRCVCGVEHVRLVWTCCSREKKKRELASFLNSSSHLR